MLERRVVRTYARFKLQMEESPWRRVRRGEEKKLLTQAVSPRAGINTSCATEPLISTTLLAEAL